MCEQMNVVRAVIMDRTRQNECPQDNMKVYCGWAAKAGFQRVSYERARITGFRVWEADEPNDVSPSPSTEMKAVRRIVENTTFLAIQSAPLPLHLPLFVTSAKSLPAKSIRAIVQMKLCTLLDSSDFIAWWWSQVRSGLESVRGSRLRHEDTLSSEWIQIQAEVEQAALSKMIAAAYEMRPVPGMYFPSETAVANGTTPVLVHLLSRVDESTFVAELHVLGESAGISVGTCLSRTVEWSDPSSNVPFLGEANGAVDRSRGRIVVEKLVAVVKGLCEN